MGFIKKRARGGGPEGPLRPISVFENNSLKRLDNMREALRGLSRLNDISCITISTLPLQMALHFLLESTWQITRYIWRCITFARWFANGCRSRDQLNKHLIIEHNHHTRCILWYFIIISHKHQPDTNYINSRLFCGFSWYKINITPRNANLLIKKPLSSTTYTMEYLLVLQKTSSRHTSQNLTAFYGGFHMKSKEKTPWNANLIIQKCLS